MRQLEKQLESRCYKIMSEESTYSRERKWWKKLKELGCPIEEPSVLGSWDAEDKRSAAQQWEKENASNE